MGNMYTASRLERHFATFGETRLLLLLVLMRWGAAPVKRSTGKCFLEKDQITPRNDYHKWARRENLVKFPTFMVIFQAPNIAPLSRTYSGGGGGWVVVGHFVIFLML